MNIGGFIGSIIDAIIYLLASISFFILYVKNKKQFHLFIAIGFLVIGVYRLVTKTIEWNEKKIPSQARFLKAIDNSSNIFKADSIVNVNNEFSILVPKGYKFTEVSQRAPVMLINENNGIVVTVEKNNSPMGSDINIRKIQKNLAAMDSTYLFSNTQDSAFTFEFDVIKNGIKKTGSIALHANQTTTYIISIVGPIENKKEILDLSDKINQSVLISKAPISSNQ